MPENMTDAELTDWLAINVMGWEKRHSRGSGRFLGWGEGKAFQVASRNWDPQHDWNDCMGLVRHIDDVINKYKISSVLNKYVAKFAFTSLRPDIVCSAIYEALNAD